MADLIGIAFTETMDDPPDGSACAFPRIIDEICRFDWQSLSSQEVKQIAHAYYYFSIQFRENLEAACRLYPHDEKLLELHKGECNTDNLSPWPEVTARNERLNHDEFVRRLLVIDAFEQTGQV